MTYFKVWDLAQGKEIYFVNDQRTLDLNTHITGFVGGEVEANAFLADARTRYLEKEAYRFTVAKEIVNGNDTTWTNADLNTPDDGGTYHVFNTITGVHEQVVGVDAAKARIEAIKQEFVVSCGLDKVTAVDVLPAYTNKYNPDVYGVEVGVIPVEVM